MNKDVILSHTDAHNGMYAWINGLKTNPEWVNASAVVEWRKELAPVHEAIHILCPSSLCMTKNCEHDLVKYNVYYIKCYETN